MHFSQQAVAALSVLVLLGALALLLRRRHAGGLWPELLRAKPAGALAVEERLALGPQHRLFVVRLEGRKILVGTSPGGVSFGPELEGFSAVLDRTRAGGPEDRR